MIQPKSARVTGLKIDLDGAAQFLDSLRPGGPWVLTAIVPDGPTCTKTFTILARARDFIIQHNECGENVYYSVNPCKTALSSKAKKADISQAEFLWVDIDPYDDETPDDLKGRVSTMTSSKEPNAIVDSGNGLQLLFRIRTVPLDNVETIADIEARNHALALEFGCDPSTRNVDRILRLPGTINYPNAKKRKAARTECRASLIDGIFTDTIYRLADFPPYEADKAESLKKDKEQNDSAIPRSLKVLLALRADPDGSIAGYPSRSELCFAFLTGALRKNISEKLIEDACLDATYRGCAIFEHCVENGARKYVVGQIEHAKQKLGSVVTLPAGVPTECAEAFVQHKYAQGNVRCLHVHRGDLFAWQESNRYQERNERTVRSELYGFLKTARVKNKEGLLVPFNPTTGKVNQIMDALRAGLDLRRDNVEPPFWLSDPGRPAKNLIACKNGLLDVETRELIPHSPDFFCVNVLPFDFDPTAPKPKRWFKFLDEVWPGDDEEPENTLQEFFGLALIGDTSYQKIIMPVGPPRSGKGTIARTLTALLGVENVASPTMASLGTNFGLAPLINKRLAIVPDARLGSRSRQAVEHLLSISGEDTLTIDRKYQDHWTGKIKALVLILTNELPKFSDASGALASRFIPLMFKESFLGREQLNLEQMLQPEMPGILNWSLKGLDYLRERGYFKMPQSSLAAVRQLQELSAPVTTFVQECCVIDPHQKIEKALLYKEWKDWCEKEGHKPGPQNTFAGDLYAAYPQLHSVRPKVKGERMKPHYCGIGLVPNDDVGAQNDDDE